ncbi:hypothetical protein EHE22_00290 [Ochrobactrum pseudogrignonense]|uniref:ABC-2 type transporter transmembrane domain-containing protein n=1 Tax=Brucella pseudogrignonensis TaxID=419475 RepID=A0A7Y3T0P5_9HYPH|nr:ABC transporter permease [Brucella pseudogrignonensis]NNV18874.1 hypothetical protein [Brucella pseudogrignonensis]
MLKNEIKNSLRLAWMLALRDVRNRYASSYAGIVWTIGVPLLYAVINVFVFSILMRGRMGVHYGDIPFSLFYFVPFTLWSFFSEVVIRSTGILKQYSYLINKISFPVRVLPLVPLASAFISQLVIVFIVVLLMSIFRVTPTWEFLPIYGLVWLSCLLLTIGFSYLISAISVYIPDMEQIIPVAVNILFWMTPILYPATLVRDSGVIWAQVLIADLNPFYYLVEFARYSVFGHGLGTWHGLILSIIACFGIFIFGIWSFKKLRPGFSDVL